jgi:hypothetical protein
VRALPRLGLLLGIASFASPVHAQKIAVIAGHLYTMGRSLKGDQESSSSAEATSNP